MTRIEARDVALKTICAYVLIVLVGTASAATKTVCPFSYLYHFGDGFTDIGNSMYVKHKWWPFPVNNPSSKPPYGITYPGRPTGRWSDGLVDFDFTARDFGRPNIVPYLNMDKKKEASYDGVIFSVARSTVLDFDFFRKRNIDVPCYAVPLRQQVEWFKKHLNSVCSNNKACIKKRLQKSFVLSGDIEANDIGYALTQGKSLEEVKTYVPEITKVLIDTTREMLKLGAVLVVAPQNGPTGCFPYILTALETDDPDAYDDLGCLKSVNDLVKWKNQVFEEALQGLAKEFPNAQIFPGPTYDGLVSLIRKKTVQGPNGNKALRACCGIGGKYNYDPKRFCGSDGVPVCCNPDDHIFWDGLHFTQETQWGSEQLVIDLSLRSLNCTTTSTNSSLLGSGRSMGSSYISSY